MALASYSHASSFATCSQLPTLSSRARTRAAILRRLADDLDVHDHDDLHGDFRLVAIVDVLLNGTEANLSRKEIDVLLRLDVPRVLVAGRTRRTR